MQTWRLTRKRILEAICVNTKSKASVLLEHIQAHPSLIAFSLSWTLLWSRVPGLSRNGCRVTDCSWCLLTWRDLSITIVGADPLPFCNFCYIFCCLRQKKKWLMKCSCFSRLWGLQVPLLLNCEICRLHRWEGTGGYSQYINCFHGWL